MRIKIANLATRIAKRKRQDNSRFRLAAVVCIGSRVHSFGINTNKPTVKAYPNSIHAEVAALHRVPRIDGGDLYVCRVLADDTLAMAKPCPCCMEVIKEAGIDTVHYSNRDGGWTSFEIIHERK